MIYYVSGPVTLLEPGLAVIEAGGVGYGCRITAYTAAQLKLNQNARLLTAAQGIGKKIAQRIILELKDKIGGSSVELDFSGPTVAAPAQQSGNVALARAALQELGYSPAEIQAALKGADPNAGTEELIRHALRAMVMKG